MNKYLNHLITPDPEITYNILSSSESSDMLCPYTFKELYDFQNHGSYFLAEQLRRRNYVACFDQQGLGKTVQALTTANIRNDKKLLIICPASLRLNWVNEINKWHNFNPGVTPIFSSYGEVDHAKSLVVSYDLAFMALNYEPDLIIIDEIHYLKSAKAKRTKIVLTQLCKKAPGILLSGTPFPNGKPSELWPTLFATAPDIIDNLNYKDFIKKYCIVYEDNFGYIQIKGAKPATLKELYTRLRGSGFMLRRTKAKVLPSLPPKRYKMVVFPASESTFSILEKEAPFDHRQIIKEGVPVGSDLADIRHEMGIAKAPQCVEYIKELLEGGREKLLIFAWHREVIAILEKELRIFHPVVITGSTPSNKRQGLVDRFQNDDHTRLFIGNIKAAGEGYTLTAAHDVVMAEFAHVPGLNEQTEDRAHRIGQTESVLVHCLVVEGSLDGKIWGDAARKSLDITGILGG